MASKQHYAVALRLRDQDLQHRVTLRADGPSDAKRRGQDDAAATSGSEPHMWTVTACDAVPAPQRRAA